MKKIAFLLSVFALDAVTGFAQTPTIAGVVSSATNIPAGLPSSGIAPGSFFTVYGSNLSSTTAASSGVPYQTTFSGSQVTVTVGSTVVPALVEFTYATQINAVLPSTTPTGAATVTVTYNGATSTSSPITIVPSSFGVFTQNGYGTGPAAAQDYDQNYATTTLIATAKPGANEILYGTGLGANPGGDQDPVTGVVPQLNLLVKTASNPNPITLTLYVGGVQAAVQYAGRSPDVALDQINFNIPSGVTGCYVPVIVVVGGVVSNSSSISIDPNGATCTDPFGLTPAQITTAASGQLSVASILLTRLSLSIGFGNPITEDSASARFYAFNGTTYTTSPLHSPDFISLSSFGSCQITDCSNTPTCVPSSQALALPHLNAGASVSLTGSGVSAVTIPADATTGFYTANVASSLALPGFPITGSYLAPGTFTVTGSGGPDINAFTASIVVPGLLNWTSTPAITSTGTLSRSQDLVVNWSGVADPNYVLVSVSSATNVGTPTGTYNAATITCLQKGSAGTFTVPAYLLAALPESSKVAYIPGLNLPGAAVLVGVFNLTNTFSSNADVSIANSIVLNGLNTNVQ